MHHTLSQALPGSWVPGRWNPGASTQERDSSPKGPTQVRCCHHAHPLTSQGQAAAANSVQSSALPDRVGKAQKYRTILPLPGGLSQSRANIQGQQDNEEACAPTQGLPAPTPSQAEHRCASGRARHSVCTHTAPLPPLSVRTSHARRPMAPASENTSTGSSDTPPNPSVLPSSCHLRNGHTGHKLFQGRGCFSLTS